MFFLFAIFAADAGVFSKKSMHGEWAERQTQQDFVLPKGWMRTELAFDHKSTGKWRDAEGKLQAHGQGTQWSYSRAWVKFDLGFSKRIRFYLHAPWVRAHLENDLDTKITTVALGDVESGIIVQPEIGTRLAVAGKLALKTPSGVEWPENFLGGPTGTQGFLTGTGVTNLGGHVLLRGLATDWFALKLDLGFVWKIPSITGYVVEKDGFGNGWLNPGDEIRVVPEVQVNVTDDLAITVLGRSSTRTTSRIGISGPGVTRRQMSAMKGTGGTFVDLGIGLNWEPNDSLDLGLSGSHQLLGSDTTHFAALGLEELSPQPGTTLGGSVGVRW